MHVHTRRTATEVLQKNNKRGKVKARGCMESRWDAARFRENWAYPGVFLEGIYDAYSNQIYARNIIKHSKTQIM